MKTETPGISIFIATLCESGRRMELLRAIQSVRDQAGIDSEIIVVVNGTGFEPDLFAQLKGRTDLRFFHQEERNLPKARLLARSMVTREFFASIDDDDEYLKDGIRPALSILRKDPSIDVVVSNGRRMGPQGDAPLFPNLVPMQANPLKALVRLNWLSSSGGIFRSATIGAEYFEEMPEYFEWTLFAFKLAMERKVFFRNEPLNRMHDTPGSLSKTLEYLYASEPILEKISRMDLHPDLRRALGWKLCDACHNISDHCLRHRDLKKAWAYHLKSLRGLYGFRYLLFTRKLMLPFTVPAEPGR
jgi:glycosyltransferase involved in cell wall biosynthesis